MLLFVRFSNPPFDGIVFSFNIHREGFIKAVVIFLALGIQLVIFLKYTNLIPSWKHLYSFDTTIRQQTESLLRGELSLGTDLRLIEHDYAWTGRVEQIWGLGISMIQLPFDLVAKTFGWIGFPDRLHFIIFYLFVSAMLCILFQNMMTPKMSRHRPLFSWFVSAGWSIIWLSAPVFLVVIFTRFSVREHSSVYGFLCSTLLFCLIQKHFLNPRLKYFYLVCIVSGLTISIRPSLLAYCIPAMALGLWSVRKCPRHAFMGSGVFLALVCFILISNQVRFGSYLEFGHRFCVTGAHVLYAYSFGKPFLYGVSLLSSILELFSLLFLIKDETLALRDFQNQPWITSAIRPREFDFSPFDLFVLMMFVASLFWLGRSSLRVFKDLRGSIHFSFEAVAFLWSALSFFILFIFYSRFYLCARYFLDFAPSFLGATVCFAISATQTIEKRWGSSKGLIFMVILLVAEGAWTFQHLRKPFYREISFEESPSTTAATELDIRTRLSTLTKYHTQPELPSVYECKTKQTEDFPHNNNLGWEKGGKCRVGMSSLHYLKSAPCVSIQFDVLPQKKNSKEETISPTEIDIRIGAHKLIRLEEPKIENSEHKLKYCLTKKPFVQSPISLVVIAWYDYRKHTHPPHIFPFRLHSIESVTS